MIILKYYNPQLNIGMADWKNVYQLPQQWQMNVEIHQGNLYYRVKGSSRRISYKKLKKGLQRKIIVLNDNLPF